MKEIENKLLLSFIKFVSNRNETVRNINKQHYYLTENVCAPVHVCFVYKLITILPIKSNFFSYFFVQ